MAIQIQRYLSMTAIQGGADAFVQATTTTDLIPADGVVFKITEILVEFQSSLASVLADTDLKWSFTRDSKAASAYLSDPDVYLSDGMFIGLVTSGMFVAPQTHIYKPEGLYIVEPDVYFQFDSTGTGQANTVNVRMYYEEQKVSEVEILRILNNA